MAKKKKQEIEDDFDIDEQDEIIQDEIIPNEIDEIESVEDISAIDECEIDTMDDCLVEDDEMDFDILFKNSANKHKLDGKHSLKRDTIFKGKLDDSEQVSAEENISYYTDTVENISSYQIQVGSIFEQESRYQQDYLNQKKLSQDVFELLQDKTEIDFTSNRRKPNRTTFNGYYKMLLTELDTKYSQSEIFVELSYYFTDNIFNMFKLLEKKYATNIIKELNQKGYLQDIGNINFV